MDPKSFKEGIIKDPDFGEAGWNAIFETPALRNPLFKKALKEGLYSDVAAALGAVQTTVLEAAFPALIGRNLIKVLPTKNTLERFYKEIRPYAWVTGEARVPRTGRRVQYQDVPVDKEIECAQEWTESYVEDASWNVLAYQIEGIGRAIARRESEFIIALYNAISAGNLAGGSEVTLATTPAWSELLTLISRVEDEDFHPNVIAVTPSIYEKLMNHDQFINALYMDPTGMAKGTILHTTLGITFVRSSLISKTLCIDVNAAAVMLSRRDLTTKPYENPGENSYGVHGSERIGLGVLQTKAVSRGSR